MATTLAVAVASKLNANIRPTVDDATASRRSFRYGAGLRVFQVAHLKIDEIDSTRMLIRVEHGKGRRDHNAMFSLQLLELLRLWWREGRWRGVMLPHG
ncbi:tyrosine-type recombinase/integrase [Mesorhizobium sp. M0276]|uniref:tyrosine-type recombinase/integrase n=1 Tax=Mesorhizobium sp. M0276 TaxID=2956928 RepID=UPI00333AF2EC